MRELPQSELSHSAHLPCWHTRHTNKGTARKEIDRTDPTKSKSLPNLGLPEIPDFVWKVAAQLVVLDFSGNNLRAVPEEISLFTNLLELNVSNNQLETLPGSVCGLTSLASLNVSKNYLTGSLFENVFTRSMANLAEVDASSNMLTGISAAVGELPNLTTLDVSGNDIREIPADLSSVPTLVSLDVCRNPLVGLPDGLVTSQRDVSHSIPIEVAPHVMVGAGDAAFNRYAMRHFGVTHILALGRGVITPDWPEASKLCDDQLEDEAGENLLAKLPKLLGFIRTALRCGVVHGQPITLIEDTPRFYHMAMQPSPELKGRRSNHGVSSVLNEVVSTIDAPTVTDTNRPARILIYGPRGSSIPAAVAAAYIMGTESASCSAAVRKVLDAVSQCESSLTVAPNAGYIQQLRQLEEGVRSIRAGGPVKLHAPCWTRHMEDGLYTHKQTPPLPQAGNAAIAMVALLQEANENQQDVAQRQEKSSQIENEMRDEEHKAHAVVLYDKLECIRHNKGKALSRMDEINADLELLSTSALDTKV
jgi:hypothetical protein